MTATSGGSPDKAVIRGIEGGGTLTVQYNPTNFQFDKQVQWKEHEEQGKEATLEFQKNSPANLSFELIFDTTQSGGDVRTAWIEKLLAFTKPDYAPKDGPAASLDKKRPTKVVFTWGQFSFTGVVENVSVTYLMFAQQGHPIRAKAQVKMKEWLAKPAAGGPANVINNGVNAIVTQVNAGQTVTAVALANNTTTQAICEANNINDPLNVDAGTMLAIPR